MHLSTVFALVAAATLGAAAPALPPRSDPTVCAPGTGFFQSCGNGFRGCCAADACTIGFCPSTTPSEEKPKTDDWEHKEPEHKEPEHWNPTTLPEGQCAPGTGFFQVCGNGFKGCCKSDACTIGYCPS